MDERLAKWCDKDSDLNGYYVDNEFNIVAHVHGVRRGGNGNIFATAEQAEASIAPPYKLYYF
jgi:hypothetical protein